MSANSVSTKERSGRDCKRNFLFVLLLLLLAYNANCQENKPFERVVIGDARYILHKVQKSQTLYSIARFYECSQEEVLAANKHITGVIKKGMVLKIPDHTYQQPPTTKVNNDKFIEYKTVSGDNYYQLKLRYGVDEEELLKYNPELKEGLKAGKMLRIPIKTKEEVVVTEHPVVNNTPPKESQAPYKAKGPTQSLNIGLYLPISAAITDSLKPTSKTLSFLAFYQGALMAVDQLAKTGLSVKLFVYDTEKSNSNVESLVKKPEFLSLDLLIGPVYPEVQQMVSELSAKNRIPMVSPLSTDDKYAKTNPWYFQVNPVKKLRIEATADYLLREFPNETITFLEGGSGSSETRQIREYLSGKKGASTSGNQLNAYNIWAKGTGELESRLTADKPNILVMADHNEVSVSVAMNRLTLLSKKYPVILVGMQEFTRMQSIEIENLHSVNLRYLSTYFVNYNLPAVSTFVESFKGEFGTEPSLFAFQGYDVTTFFLKSLYRQERLPRTLATTNGTGLLHTSYHFTKLSDFGGYTNDSFTVVEYANTFEVRSLGVIRQGE